MASPFLDLIARGYVINLASRPDRLAEVRDDLARAGMPIDDDQIRVFPGIRPPDAGSFESIGVHGCYLSHLGILHDALKDKLDNVFVMEDDWQHTPAFAKHADQVVEQLRRIPWDIAFVGHAENVDDLIVPNGPPVNFQYWPKERRVIHAHAYLVNGTVLPRLVEALDLYMSRPVGHPDGGSIPLDGAISTFRAQNPDVRTLITAPNLIRQRSSASDISPRWWDRHPRMRPVGRLLRAVRSAFVGPTGK